MLFNSGTPSLISWTRALVGDPSTAASTQWDDTTEVKPAINRAYLELREIARMFGLGATTKRSYADAVADQIYYQRPADLVKLEAVELSNNGSNLSTTAPSSADIYYPKPWVAEKALQAYNGEIVTTVAEYFFLQDDHYGIVSPPTSTQAGTKTIRLLYEASTAELSGDTDEPEIFRPYHDLICYMAGKQLKIMRDEDYSNLNEVIGDGVTRGRLLQFKMACQDAISMHEAQIPAAGQRRQSSAIAAGRVVRSG